MASEINPYKLGLFVCCALVIAVAGVIALGAGRYFRETERFITYFDESVQGLDVGSSVKFRGVPVGRVSSIYVASQRDLVAVEIEVFPHTFTDERGLPVRGSATGKMLLELVEQGLRVRLAMVGITGLKYLELDRLDPRKYPVPKLAFRPPYLSLPSAPSALKGLEADVTTAVGRLAQIDFGGIAERTKRVLERVDTVLAAFDSPKIAKQVEDVLAESQSVAAEVKKLVARVDSAVSKADLDAALKDGRDALESAKALAARLNEQGGPLLTEAEKVLKDLQKTNRRVAELAEQVEKVLAEADVPGAVRAAKNAFERGAAAAEGVTSLRDDMRRALRELSASLQIVRRFVDYMERNPDALISGKREPNP